MRRVLTGALPVLLAMVALACQAEPPPPRAERPAPAAGSPSSVLPAGVPADLPTGSAAGPAAVMLAVVNAERGGKAAPLAIDPLLAEVVQGYVDELQDRNVLPAGDVSQRMLDRLNERGYKAYRVVISFAQIEGDFASAVERWRAADEGTFDRFDHAELRDFALGVGSIRGLPLYLAIGAVRQQQHYEAETADLRKDLEKLRQEELRRVNARRAEDRLPGLRRHPSLDLAAQRYAEEMLRRGFYGHYSPEGQDVGDRVRAARYSYRKVGENLASGQTSVAAVVDGWIDSPDHLRNLVDPEFQEIGIGFAAGPTRDGSYGFLWVQVFGEPRR